MCVCVCVCLYTHTLSIGHQHGDSLMCLRPDPGYTACFLPPPFLLPPPAPPPPLLLPPAPPPLTFPSPLPSPVPHPTRTVCNAAIEYPATRCVCNNLSSPKRSQRLYWSERVKRESEREREGERRAGKFASVCSKRILTTSSHLEFARVSRAAPRLSTP